jgi:putative FmdB family regulatory protein
MPIFEYRCSDCGHVTAFLEKARGRRRHPCEECGSTKTDKLLSTFAAHSAGPSPAAACPQQGTCTSATCPLSR